MANLFRTGFGDLSDFLGKLDQGGFGSDEIDFVRKNPHLVADFKMAIAFAQGRLHVELIEIAGPYAMRLGGRGQFVTQLGESHLAAYAGSGGISIDAEVLGSDWVLHPRCVRSGLLTGDVEFQLVRYASEDHYESGVAIFARFGFLPATHIQALEFAKAFPRELDGKTVVALGSRPASAQAASPCRIARDTDGRLRACDARAKVDRESAGHLLFIRQSRD